MTRPLWKVYIQWDRTNFMLETSHVYYVEYQRGTQHKIGPSGKGFERPRLGKGKILFLNEDGRYDPRNTASPLYPHVTPGAPVVIYVSADGGSNWVPRFRGRVADIKPTKSRAVRAVEVSLREGWDALENTVYTDVLEDVYADDAINAVLDAVDWPAGARDIDNGRDYHSYWWAEGGKAIDEIMNVVGAEFGRIWLDGDGVIHFRNRHSGYTPVALLDATNLRPETSLSQPWDVVRNAIRVPVSSFRELTNEVVWTQMQPLYIGGSGSVTLWVSYTFENIPVRVTSLVGTDYTANENEDGSGADRTSDLSVSVSPLSSVAKVTLTNTSVAGLYVTELKLRADGLQILTATTVTAENADSIARYGRREFDVDTPWVEDLEVATDYANFLSTWLADAIIYPQLVLRAQPATQVLLDVGKSVTVNLPEEYVTGDYEIIYIDERWRTRDGSIFETTVRLSPQFAFSDHFWTFPTKLGITSRFGY